MLAPTHCPLVRACLIGLALALLAACVTRQYDTDATAGRQAAPVVGHCYDLRREAAFHPDLSTRTLAGAMGAVLNYSGFIYINVQGAPTVKNDIQLPVATRFTVERVIAQHEPTVGAVLKPYVRLGVAYGGLLAEASSLFEVTADHETIKPVAAYVRDVPCR
jgi:hypothetical protein